MANAEPPTDCGRCPRLVQLRLDNQMVQPDWFNRPVPSFGDPNARLCIVGLAPGLRGANRTGRPFTGDFAGDMLYRALMDFGFAQGTYGACVDDGLVLKDCLITNAVRCVPPDNKPTAAEVNACRPFLIDRLREMPRLRVVLALGRIAHDSTVRALGERPAAIGFAHGASHGLANGITLFDSYHCSRYNTNTGRLTVDMFRTVVRAIVDHFGPAQG